MTLAAGPVEKISTSLGDVGALERFVVEVGAGVGDGATEVEGGTGGTEVGDATLGDATVGETATWLDAIGTDPGAAGAAWLDVPATAVTACARAQSSNGTGVPCEACTCITSPSRASANTEHESVPNRARNESAEYCGATVRTTLPAATRAARN